MHLTRQQGAHYKDTQELSPQCTETAMFSKQQEEESSSTGLALNLKLEDSMRCNELAVSVNWWSWFLGVRIV